MEQPTQPWQAEFPCPVELKRSQMVEEVLALGQLSGKEAVGEVGRNRSVPVSAVKSLDNAHQISLLLPSVTPSGGQMKCFWRKASMRSRSPNSSTWGLWFSTWTGGR